MVVAFLSGHVGQAVGEALGEAQDLGVGEVFGGVVAGFDDLCQRFCLFLHVKLFLLHAASERVLRDFCERFVLGDERFGLFGHNLAGGFG